MTRIRSANTIKEFYKSIWCHYLSMAVRGTCYLTLHYQWAETTDSYSDSFSLWNEPTNTFGSRLQDVLRFLCISVAKGHLHRV